MKKLLTVMFALAAFAGQAQMAPAAKPVAYPTDATTGRLDYTEAVPVAGANKAELFTRAKVWLANSFKSAKEVVQTEDKEAGIIVGKGYSAVNIQSGDVMFPHKLYYTLKINFKDNKYKYEFTDFYFESEPTAGLDDEPSKSEAEIWLVKAPIAGGDDAIVESFKRAFNDKIPALVASLKAGMLKSSDF